MTTIDATTVPPSTCGALPLAPLQQLDAYKRQLNNLTAGNNKLFVKYVKALKGERRATTAKQASYHRCRAEKLRNDLTASYASIKSVQNAMAVLQHSLQFPGQFPGGL